MPRLRDVSERERQIFARALYRLGYNIDIVEFQVGFASRGAKRHVIHFALVASAENNNA